MSTTKTKKTTKTKGTETSPEPIAIAIAERRNVTVWLLGVTPMICNKQSIKTKRTLILPSYFTRGKADRASTLKHDPLMEYRESIYRDDREDAPTLIQIKGGAVKSATCDSAVDVEGMQAAPVRRAVSVPSWYLNVYGVPQMFITDVRQSGPARTPDMRTRAIIPNWAIEVQFSFAYPMVNQTQVLNLCANGGMLRGLGDGRVEKGALDFGQYEVTNVNDPRIQQLIKKGGRAAQVAAMGRPGYFDVETKELYEWFEEALKEKGKTEQATLIAGNGHMEDEEALEQASLV